MPGNPNKLSQFWQELKRRRVVHVITVYASASFVLIELVNNLTEPLNLPPNLATIVVIVLAVGFPLAVILAWIYDLTPEGIEKTSSPGEVEDEKKPVVPNAWRIATYVSFVVIAGLITLNIVGGPKQLRAGDIQSLVILPFENFTGDTELENMVAGMQSLLIGDMSRVSGLRIIGSTSSRLYKEADMSAGDIASELNVDAVVEATVMCLGDSVCMQFRLINTTGEEEQLWVGDYREDKSQILNLYNKVTRQITGEILVELTDSEEKVLSKDRVADRDAIDAYIRSHTYWGDLSTEAFDNAEEYLTLAIEKDAEWSTLYAAMAVIWAARLQMGKVESEKGRQLVYENIRKARELDPEFSDAHFINAILATWTDWDWELGEKEFLKALGTNPNHVMSRIYYAQYLLILQRREEAMVQGKLALDLDPKNPLVLALYSVLLKGTDQDPLVMEYLEKALAIEPEHSFTRGQLGRAYYNLGEYEKNLEIQGNYLVQRLGEELVPDLDSLYRKEGRLVTYREVARLWELYMKDHTYRNLSLAGDLYRAGWYSRTIDELEKAFEMHNPNLPYIGTGKRYEALHDSVRFQAILKKMNLPLPKS